MAKKLRTIKYSYVLARFLMREKNSRKQFVLIFLLKNYVIDKENPMLN